jgi:hypothetical protein
MGTEVDVYAGYGTAAEIFSLGGTGCYYPDQFEDRHLELH